MKNKNIQKFKKAIMLSLVIFVIIEACAVLTNWQIPIHILIKAPTSQAYMIQNSCNDFPNERCYAKYFYDTTKKNGIKFAISTLSELNKIEPNSRGCHLIAHSISLAATEKYPDKWQDILNEIDINMCTGGFLHGVIEAHAKISGNFKIDGANIEKLCSLVGNRLNYMGEQNCSHIMGHLALAQEIGAIDRAIEICSTADNDIRYECYSGVFMENETRENLNVHANFPRISWNEENTLKQEEICRNYTGIISDACWRELSHMLVMLENNDPIKVRDRCANAPSKTALDECYNHAVSIMIVSNLRKEDYKNLCSEVTDETSLKKCIGHAIGGLLNSSQEYIYTAVDFCESIDSLNYKTYCYEAIGIISLATLGAKNHKELCEKIPSEFIITCVNSQGKSLY